MIRHILTIIWNERKANSWIVVEYTLVFCILWFCCDYLYFMGKSYMEPLGFDIEHTYLIQMGEKSTDMGILEQEDTYANFQIFLDRVKHYPGIESVSLSQASVPYCTNFTACRFFINTDSLWLYTQMRYVSPEFFDVFRIKLESGRIFNEQEERSNSGVLITPDRHQQFGGINQEAKPATQVKTLTMNEEQTMLVTGITTRVKSGFYEPYTNGLFAPINLLERNLSRIEITVRVRPEADRDFAKQFTHDMREQLIIGPFFLTNVTSVTQLRKNTMKSEGITSNLNSVYSITTFLIINIFLGIIGTFWYRTQSRRSEIGLRIAMGATKQQIRTMLFSETLLLLFLASIIGINICLNVSQTDLLQILGIPRSNHAQAGIGIEQYFINYALTFGFLALVSLTAVWYPARQAANIPPMEALREE